jgi:hypothetical protein
MAPSSIWSCRRSGAGRTIVPRSLLVQRTVAREARERRHQLIEADAVAQAKREALLAKREAARAAGLKPGRKKAPEDRMPTRKLRHAGRENLADQPHVTGKRQAEIETKCLVALLNWLAVEYEVPGVRTFHRLPFLKRLKQSQEPHQPRFDDAETARLESKLHLADPRLWLPWIPSPRCRCAQAARGAALRDPGRWQLDLAADAARHLQRGHHRRGSSCGDAPDGGRHVQAAGANTGE